MQTWTLILCTKCFAEPWWLTRNVTGFRWLFSGNLSRSVFLECFRLGLELVLRFRSRFSFTLNFRVPRLALDVVTGGEEEIVRFILFDIYCLVYNLFFHIKSGWHCPTTFWKIGKISILWVEIAKIEIVGRVLGRKEHLAFFTKCSKRKVCPFSNVATFSWIMLFRI